MWVGGRENVGTLSNMRPGFLDESLSCGHPCRCTLVCEAPAMAKNITICLLPLCYHGISLALCPVKGGVSGVFIILKAVVRVRRVRGRRIGSSCISD